MRDYSKYIAENLDKNIKYSKYIAENLDGYKSKSQIIREERIEKLIKLNKI